MANFAKKKIALAVGAGLLAMAGGAQAAAPALLSSATQKAVAVAATGYTPAVGIAAAADLYTTAGTNKAVLVRVLFNVAADVDEPTAFKINDATDANSDAIVKAGSTKIAAALLPTYSPDNGTTKTANSAATAFANAGTIDILLDPAAGGATVNRVRIDNATGKLQFSSDSGTTWADVTVEIKNGDSALTDGTTALAASLGTQTAYASDDFVLTHEVKTYAAAGASLISGLTVDFKHPVTAPTNTELLIKSRVPTPVVGTSKVKTAGTITGVTGTNVTIAAATGSTTAYDVKIGDLTKVDWDNTDAAGGALDVAAATSVVDFNTGVTGAGVPLELAFDTAKKVDYSNIYSKTAGTKISIGIASTGTKTFAATGTSSIDGAAPVLMSIVSDPTGQPTGETKLTLNFSEVVGPTGNVAVAGGGTVTNADLRELAENVLIGTDTLAAVTLNDGKTLVATAPASTDGRGSIALTGVRAASLTGKQVTVNKGISLLEQDDAGWKSGQDIFEAGDGFTTLKGDEALSAAAKNVDAAALTIGFGTDATASAATTVADPTKVGSVAVKFKAGKSVVVATGKTTADLASDLVVEVDGANAKTGAPDTFKFYPKAADLAINGDTLTITLPTALVYANIDATNKITVKYAVTNVADVLVAASDATVKVAAGTVTASLPLSAQANSSDLLTQSVTGTLTGASNGSLVHAYLAEWVDAPSVSGFTATISDGRITNPSDKDKVATDLTINYSATAGGQKAVLEGKIQTALFNAQKAAVNAVAGVSEAVAAGKLDPIPVYVQISRSNDVVANAKTSENFVFAKATLSTVAEDAAFNTTDPVFVAYLDPKSGAITGRLTGQLKISATPTLNNRGLVSSTEVAQGLVDATGKFNLLLAVDPKTSDLVKKGSNLFTILVHEDQNNTRKYTQLTSADPAAANFVPFEPNLISGKGVKTVLGAAGGIAAPFVATVAAPTAANIDLAKYKVATADFASAWRLTPLGNPAIKLDGFKVERTLVGLADGTPTSFWTNDTATADAAFALANGAVGVATELSNKATLSTLKSANFVAGAAGLAWYNDNNAGGTTDDVTFAQAAAVTPKLGAGWSLVTVPAGGTFTANTVEAVIRVGNSATAGYHWFKADGGTPAVTAGEAVFVYSSKGGNL